MGSQVDAGQVRSSFRYHHPRSFTCHPLANTGTESPAVITALSAKRSPLFIDPDPFSAYARSLFPQLPFSCSFFRSFRLQSKLCFHRIDVIHRSVDIEI